MPRKRKTVRTNSDRSIQIPERKQILNYLRKRELPCNLKEIARALDVKTSDERAALNKRLKSMLRDGEIIKNRREGYGLVEKMNLIAGEVIGHPDGYGFLKPDSGREDIYLPAAEMRRLLHGDRALVRHSGHDKKGRSRGTVVEVLDRANSRVVGRYFRESGFGYVVPDNKRIHQDVLIPKEDSLDARPGCYVVAEILRQPDDHTQPVGRIVEELQPANTTDLATDIAIRSHELPYAWPDEVLEQIAGIDPRKRLSTRGRTDLRETAFVTIDGEDARDFDDAVYCERTGGGWRLLVAIADVSNYVKPGTALDSEASTRGTSVYFPRRVIPMLPEILSNELCSLQPDVERYAMVCEMQVSDKGKVRKSRFYQAVIRSAARLTYDEVAAIEEKSNKSLMKKYNRLLPNLESLYSLYRLMHRRRAKSGLLDFDATESRILFDEQGNISAIQPLHRNDAHRLIEEFMLAANVSAASFLIENKIPALFRNHEPPREEKLADLREFLADFGLKLGGGEEPTASHYADLLEQVKSREDAHLIETVLLRSMQLAFYGEKNTGHFGLAFDAYTHFTSPIRRYPDLLVHRAIKKATGADKSYPYGIEDMQNLGSSCSRTERRAEEAGRNVVQRLKCIFMYDKLGETFEGTVSSVTGFGLFVELDELYVEGLVHVTSLPVDYYHFDPVAHLLRGEKTGREFRLASRIRVKVIRVDIDESKIDLEIAEKSRPGRTKRKKKKVKSKKVKD